MNPYLFVSIIEIIFIAILSGLIAYEFYKSQDGRLRILIIRLFEAKVWLYGGSVLFYFIALKIDVSLLKLLLITPMAVIMFQLWDYIRIRNKKK